MCNEVIHLPDSSTGRKAVFRLLLILSVGAGYYLSAWIGLLFVSNVERIAVFWPPGGFVFALLLISHRKLWSNIILAVFASNFTANYFSGNTVMVSAGFAVVNSIEPLFLAFVMTLKRFNGFSILTLKGIFRLFWITPLVIAVTSFMGAAVTCLGYSAPYLSNYLQWFLSDTFGILIVSPFIFSIFEYKKIDKEVYTAVNAEANILWGTALVLSLIIFMYGGNEKFLFGPYILLPIFILMAVRHNLLYSISCLTISCCIAIWGTANGLGAFGKMSVNSKDALLALQIFLGFEIVSVLLIGVTSYQNKILDKATREVLRDREWLLKELHHRVKNNMNIISSLFSLQAGNINNKKASAILKDSQSRVHTMAMVHEKLYTEGNLKETDFSAYVEGLIDSIRDTYMVGINISIETEMDSINVNSDVLVPCGLIINELVTNSIKYAFENVSSPVISIKLAEKEDGIISLIVSDNGKGLPENFNYKESTGLGFMLVTALTKQINGTLTVGGSNGTRVEIIFNKDYKNGKRS